MQEVIAAEWARAAAAAAAARAAAAPARLRGPKRRMSETLEWAPQPDQPLPPPPLEDEEWGALPPPLPSVLDAPLEAPAHREMPAVVRFETQWGERDALPDLEDEFGKDAVGSPPPPPMPSPHGDDDNPFD